MHRTTFTALLLFAATGAFANNSIESEITALCEKTKKCVITEMEKSLPPELRDLAAGMAAKACIGIQESYAHTTDSEYAALADSARACLTSLRAKSCDELISKPESPECTRFEQEAQRLTER